MESDPLRFFDQQFQSYDVLEQHRERLIADARELLDRHPDARAAGLICTTDSPEFAAFMARFGIGGDAPAQGLVGLVPLQWVEEIIDRLSPHLPPVRIAPGDVRLPVLVSTKDGQRLGMFSFPRSPPLDT